MKFINLLLALLITGFATFAQINYDNFFTGNSLRIDYILMVGKDTTLVSIQQLKQEPYWAGNPENLIDPFGFGNYRYEVYDSATNKLIYSNGYSSLSAEWRINTRIFNKTELHSFYEAVNVPYPRQTIRFVLKYRDRQLRFHKLIDTFINPQSIYISHEQVKQYPVKWLVKNGDPQNKVDLVILPDGYTQEQMQLFEQDAKRIIAKLFQYEPFARHKNDFNIAIVLAPSQQSGCDNPGQHIWRNTILNSHFYTFKTPRYLTTEDYKTAKDLASLVPYDQIIVLVNTATYGGGGFYNFINLTAARNPKADPVFVHEFGHAFAGLADEYVDPEEENFYDTTREPWEANITTLVDFQSKWKDLVADTVPVPTPQTPEYSEVVGAFEGAGYRPTGIYRPQQKCLMRQLDAVFCKVCQRTIEQIINYYVK